MSNVISKTMVVIQNVGKTTMILSDTIPAKKSMLMKTIVIVFVDKA